MTHDILPAGWAWSSLARLLETHGPGVWGRASQDAELTLRIVRNGDINKDGSVSVELPIRGVSGKEAQKAALQPGDVLVATSGDIGKCAIWPSNRPDCGISNFARRLRAGPGLEAKYLYYWLRTTSVQTKLNQRARGVTIRNLPSAVWDEMRIPVPSMREQRRVVAALEEHLSDLDAAVQGLERAREHLVAYLSASLEAAVRGRLSTTMGGLPTAMTYEWRPLQDTITSISQGWSPKCDTVPPIDDADWGVIKTTAVQAARYDTAESKRLPDRFSPRPDLEIRVGDLLVTRKGPRTRAGVAAAVRSTRPRLMICDTVYRIRLKTEMARPHYMAIAMSSPTVSAAINAAKAGISESGVSLTHDRLGAILVPLPSLDEQAAIETEIDRRMDAAERVRAEIDRQLVRAARLRQSILKRAYEGKLIPQNPSDEPANGVLERISGTLRSNPSTPAA